MMEKSSVELIINDEMAKINYKIEDKICSEWKLDRKDVEKSLMFKNSITMFLKNQIKEAHSIRDAGYSLRLYQEILDWIDNYDKR